MVLKINSAKTDCQQETFKDDVFNNGMTNSEVKVFALLLLLISCLNRKTRNLEFQFFQIIQKYLCSVLRPPYNTPASNNAMERRCAPRNKE